MRNNGVILSPASGLNHEADHALHHMQKGDKHNSEKKPDKLYDNSEEKRVITGSEQNTAFKLGEIKNGESTREDHEGTPYEVIGPTSIVGVNEIIIKPTKTKKIK